MHHLYDMGFYINRSLHRTIKNYKKQEIDERFVPSYKFAKDVATDIVHTLEEEISSHPDTEDKFTLCFDDKDNQIRPEYKQRQTSPKNHVVKYLAQELLLNAWQNCKAEKCVGFGLEADDWIYKIREENSAKGIETRFYANDYDLLCNIDAFTTGVIHKQDGQYYVHSKNWEYMFEEVFRQRIPYNAIWLYKVTVGDSSDHIAGIKGFGDKAFDKLVKAVTADGVDFASMRELDKFEEFLSSEDGLSKYLKDDQLWQAFEAWSLVCPVVEGHTPVQYQEKKEEEIER